jgi:CheY-like chemotaxis protein
VLFAVRLGEVQLARRTKRFSTLRFRRDDHAPEEAERPTAHKPRSATIGTLVVDDIEDMRRLIRITLETAGEQVVVTGEAASGREALEQVEACDPQVIVLDQMMPDLDGLDTAALILERRADQPIILFSAYMDSELEERAESMGVKVLSKVQLGALPEACRRAAVAARR